MNTEWRHAIEDEEERKLCHEAERLVMRLDHGFNVFDEAQFDVLVRYTLPERDWKRARKTGRFQLGDVVIARVATGLVTISDMARRTGVPRKTLERWVANTNARWVKAGRRKLYDIKELTGLLAKKTA